MCILLESAVHAKKDETSYRLNTAVRNDGKLAAAIASLLFWACLMSYSAVATNSNCQKEEQSCNDFAL
jgi:hypothetical protein